MPTLIEHIIRACELAEAQTDADADDSDETQQDLFRLLTLALQLALHTSQPTLH